MQTQMTESLAVFKTLNRVFLPVIYLQILSMLDIVFHSMTVFLYLINVMKYVQLIFLFLFPFFPYFTSTWI